MKSFAFARSGSFAQWLSITATLLSILSGCYGTPTHGGKGRGGAGGTGGAAGSGGLAGSAGAEARGGAGGAVGAGGAGGSAAGGTAGAGPGGSGGMRDTTGTGGSSGTSGGGGTGSCSAPNTRCPDVCTNLATDVKNCTACDNACLPPPANGHAVCQAAAGCGIECDSGHLKCGSTCCDTPPSSAFATCSTSSICGVQCNSGNHACNGTSSPCYDDTDVTHCGSSCTDCRQPNATPVCTGTQCANICNGTTLSCPGTTGHVVCGTWDFESGTLEGWTNNSAAWSKDGSDGMLVVSTKRALTGTHSLAITHDNPTGAFAVSAIKVHLCPTGVPVDLSSKSLTFWFYLDPSIGGDLDGTNSEFEYQLSSGSNGFGYPYLDNGMPLPAGQWLMRSAALAPPATAGTTSITDVEIVLDTSNKPWVGTVYFDDFRIQ